jgi:hypothetical protein
MSDARSELQTARYPVPCLSHAWPAKESIQQCQCTHSSLTWRSSAILSHSTLTMAAATPADSTAAMEAMFQPSNRLREVHGLQQLTPFEFELLPHLTPQDVLATIITAQEFHRFLGRDRRLVSMTPGVFVSDLSPA